MSRRYLGSVSVDVDIDDVLGNIGDDDLIEECVSRKLIAKRAILPQPFVKDYVELAYEELLRGRHSAAIALLDRALFPTDAVIAPESGSMILVEKRS